MSSSWNDDASHTIVASAATLPISDDAAVPTLPATATGRPASRWMWPIHSVVVVLPLVPVTAMNSFGEQPPGELELAEHGHAARSRRRDDRGASWGTPGLLMSVRARGGNGVA